MQIEAFKDSQTTGKKPALQVVLSLTGKITAEIAEKNLCVSVVKN